MSPNLTDNIRKTKWNSSLICTIFNRLIDGSSKCLSKLLNQLEIISGPESVYPILNVEFIKLQSFGAEGLKNLKKWRGKSNSPRRRIEPRPPRYRRGFSQLYHRGFDKIAILSITVDCSAVLAITILTTYFIKLIFINMLHLTL